MSIEQKRIRIELRLSSEEKAQFKRKAASLGFRSISKYIKLVILNQREIKPKVDVELALQIRKIGVNINQMVALCNHYKTDKVIKDIGLSLESEIQLLNKILAKL
ncbi:MAG: MobC family plasmid mobilization relaxosome protein [Bacteroidales bacterium]|jgi:hypothetical protein|nr:MobC family plasmid mobilization relaxosome protein [Bacteroidales bacterium]